MTDLTMLKGKYMPLSEANIRPIMVSAYDGQSIYVGASNKRRMNIGNESQVHYTMGNYLGSGIAGVVYEAYDRIVQRHVAIKILTPVGYKLCSPSALRRGEIIKAGVPVLGNVRNMTLENVYWVHLPNRKDLIACYATTTNNGTSTSSMSQLSSNSPQYTTDSSNIILRELTLEMCVALWSLESQEDDEMEDDMEKQLREDTHVNMNCEEPVNEIRDSNERLRCSPSKSTSTSTSNAMKIDQESFQQCRSPDRVGENTFGSNINTNLPTVLHRDIVYRIPKLPTKYANFLDSRKVIYREIAHMHKLTGNSISGQVGGGHANVLKLYDVLEFLQPSKSTIFLVLELAGGGELFDRIRSDNGVDENIARGYFQQLLSGVLYCHQLGIVHRDLKPENLLLSDTDVLKIADFGLSAHFIAAVSGALETESSGNSSNMELLPAHFRRLNSVVGSPHYVAPEILQNARYGYDGRKADMWSVGVILYGMLVGSLPFGKELATCPRYLKCCEWIRSLPHDSHTGKLLYQPDLYQPASPGSSPTYLMQNFGINSSGSNQPTSNLKEYKDSSYSPIHDLQSSQLPLSQCGQNVNRSSSGWAFHQNGAIKSPAISNRISTSGNLVLSGNGRSALNLGGRRSPPAGTSIRTVAFPTWLFPSKLSPQAVYLLTSLLHPEPSKRYTCEDACKALWTVKGVK